MLKIFGRYDPMATPMPHWKLFGQNCTFIQPCFWALLFTLALVKFVINLAYKVLFDESFTWLIFAFWSEWLPEKNLCFINKQIKEVILAYTILTYIYQAYLATHLMAVKNWKNWLVGWSWVSVNLLWMQEETRMLLSAFPLFKLWNVIAKA